MLPFTREQFLQVFARYNEAVWPLQWIAWLLGLATCIAVARAGSLRERAVPAVLALLWVWTGIAYHGVFFSVINRAALLFGALFVLQGLLFAACAWRGTLRFGRRGIAAALAWGLALYALVAYPLLGLYAGHGYPQIPLFGVTPCPLVLFTFGMLLLAVRVPWWLLVVPVAWSLVGGSAAFLLGVPQDWPLLFSAAAAAVPLLSRGQSVPSVLHPSESLE
jgi:hypothetical protein